MNNIFIFVFTLIIFWVFATFSFISLASAVGRILFVKFESRPVEISIRDTNFPLAAIPFPSITLCPTNNINVAVAKKYLSRFLNESDEETSSTIYNVISALYLLKYPTYIQMRPYLKASRNFLRRFDSMNITDFMLMVLPHCSDLMTKCYWHGKWENCCTIFNVQPTEEGFCYSFNDFTSPNKLHCPVFDLTKHNFNYMGKMNCHPKFLTFSGVFSGLTIHTKKIETPENFLRDNQTFVPGVRVMVSSAYDYPVAGSGILLETLPGQMLQLEVKPVVLLSDPEITRIAREERKCMLKPNTGMHLTQYYSQSSCYLTCRHNFIIRKCRCQLYFFFQPSRREPLCKVSQLLCVTKYSYALRRTTPSPYNKSQPQVKDYLNCVCQPGCNQIWYDQGVKFSNASYFFGRNEPGLIDIFYARFGALKYNRHLAFNEKDLIGMLPSISHDDLKVQSRKVYQDRILSIEKAYVKRFKRQRSFNLLKEFTQASTIHGIQHIFREGETKLHRIIWTLFFLTCFSSAAYLMHDSWKGSITVPIAVTVSDINHPLDGIHFPAVSVCPLQKIVKTKAVKYLYDNVGNWVHDEGEKVNAFLDGLAALQHPLYHDMALFLDKSRDILPRLEKVNITDLMLNSLPSFQEIFLTCYWEGRRYTCAKLFSPQRSEAGFCYSFNSFTNEQNKNCIYKDRDGFHRENCTLFHTAGTGPRSGLELLLKEAYQVTIIVHHPNEYPEAGMGSVIPVGAFDKLNVGVKPIITEASEDIRDLTLEESGCYFKDSMPSMITKIYSQQSCLLQCRMTYLLKQCECLPYYIIMKRASVPCNSTQLYCIIEHKDNLRFFIPPSDSSKVSEEVKKNSLDCTHCLPTCNERVYDLDINLTKDSTGRKRDYHAYVDVFYRLTRALLYKREMTYDYVQQLVNIGGIGGLFLGGSVLSLLEAAYWLTKSFLTYIWPVGKNKIMASKQNQIKSVFMSNQAWLN